MVQQGRADGYRVQDLSIVCFDARSYNSPPTGVTELARDRMPGLIKMSGLGTTRDATCYKSVTYYWILYLQHDFLCSMRCCDGVLRF